MNTYLCRLRINVQRISRDNYFYWASLSCSRVCNFSNVFRNKKQISNIFNDLYPLRILKKKNNFHVGSYFCCAFMRCKLKEFTLRMQKLFQLAIDDVLRRCFFFLTYFSWESRQALELPCGESIVRIVSVWIHVGVDQHTHTHTHVDVRNIFTSPSPCTF